MEGSIYNSYGKVSTPLAPCHTNPLVRVLGFSHVNPHFLSKYRHRDTDVLWMRVTTTEDQSGSGFFGVT